MRTAKQVQFFLVSLSQSGRGALGMTT